MSMCILCHERPAAGGLLCRSCRALADDVPPPPRHRRVPVAVLRRARRAGAVKCSWAWRSNAVELRGETPVIESAPAVVFWDQSDTYVGTWLAEFPRRFVDGRTAAGVDGLDDAADRCHQFAPLPGAEEDDYAPDDLFAPWPLPHEVMLLGTSRARDIAVDNRVAMMMFVADRRNLGQDYDTIRHAVHAELREPKPCRCGLCDETAAAVAARTFAMIDPGEFEA